MPRLIQGRIRPITGEIYFTNPEAYGDLQAELQLLGLSNGGENGGAGSGGGGGSGNSSAFDRFLVVGTTLQPPQATLIVDNSYTGPVTNSAGSYPAITVDAVVDVSSVPKGLLGHPIMVYSIPQVVQVTYPASLSNGGIFLDNYPVNRTDFRMVRGVQNEIRFYVRDLDRKPVPIGNSESFTINIVDIGTNTLLMTRNLTALDSANGVYLLTVLPSEMDSWATTPARWSLGYNRADGSTVLMWTDRSYSPYSTCTITEGPVPGPAPTVILQTNQLTMMNDGNLYSPALVGASAHGFVGGVQTFVITMTDLTGTVRIDGSLVVAPVNSPFSSDWFAVDQQTYSGQTGTVILNEIGNFLWMRVAILATAGTINLIQYKS